MRALTVALITAALLTSCTHADHGHVPHPAPQAAPSPPEGS